MKIEHETYSLSPSLLCGRTACRLLGKGQNRTAEAAKTEPSPVYFKVDPETAGTVTGQIHFKGKRPAPKAIDMSEEPACVEAHHGKAYDESLVVNKNGAPGKCLHLYQERFGGEDLCNPGKPGHHRSKGLLVSSAGAWHSDRAGIEGRQLRSGDAQYPPHGAKSTGNGTIAREPTILPSRANSSSRKS